MFIELLEADKEKDQNQTKEVLPLKKSSQFEEKERQIAL